ncbi:MAG: MEDS domain-containing protein [Candidatus Baltobacteraceae bacterium]
MGTRLELDRGSHEHVVQFCGSDDSSLVRNVSEYLSAGILLGQGALIIAGTERSTAFVNELSAISGCNGDQLRKQAGLLDAADTLAAFMRDGWPDPDLFDAVVGSRVRESQQRHGHVRAFGEMVELLWMAGEASAAIELEDLWTRLLEQGNLDLFCSYSIDVFGAQFQAGCLDGLLSTHSRFISGTSDALGAAMERALEEVLGPKFYGLRLLATRTERASWPPMPQLERTVLWLRRYLPRYADEILDKARAYSAA